VIHNLKHPVTGEVTPHVVTTIPSFGEDRVYAKEQALVDLVASELVQDRPCVIYVRQTATRDIQPRIAQLIRERVPLAKTYILKNTVSAERREAVIEAEIARGTNVIISNPELVKTGLDLVFAPTLIFYEIVFNLGTMMQAAGRSYRLNQTHPHCKTYYLYAEGTMEHTAVQLMSRKQRAAKLLTGDIGLTGLDALTEGEGGFEEALLAAIGRDEALLDPTEMFKASAIHGEIDAEDAAYWNVEVTPEPVAEPEVVQKAGQPQTVLEAAEALGGKIVRIHPAPTRQESSGQAALAYLETVHIVADESRLTALRAELADLLAQEPDRVLTWLRDNRVVFPGCEEEVAAQLIRLTQDAAPEITHEPPPVSVMPLPTKTRSAPVKRAEPVRAAAFHQPPEPLQLTLF
jgi:hypothetical protein